MATHAHKGHGPRQVSCAVITVSDTRSETDDASGTCIKSLLVDSGHTVAHYAIVKDEPEQIRASLAALPAGVQAVILNGGTGLARRDTTYEAVQGLLEKTIDGFGELFRMLSFEEIGAAAMLSRATAGVADGRAVFSLPGSTKAVDLGMRRLILPELGHIVGLLGD